MTLSTDRPAYSDKHSYLLQDDSEERFGNLVGRITDYCINLLSPSGNVLTWNAGGEHVTGYPAADMIGHSFECLYTPEARAAGRPGLLLATARTKGRVEDVDWRVRKDGSRFLAHVVITALRDGRGRLFGFAAVSRDLTARSNEAQVFLRRTGEELSASLDYETTLQRVVHQAVPSLADMCWADLVDDHSLTSPRAVAHVDPAKQAWLLERIRGCDQAPAPVQRVLRTGEPLVMPTVSESVLRTIAEEEHAPLKGECLATLHELHTGSALYMPLIARGRMLGALELMRVNGSSPFGLQDMVLVQQLANQCALALDNARLYGEAQQAIRVRDEFLATTSHELRRPLSEIKGFTTTLLRTDVRWDEPLGQDFLEEIDRQTDVLDTLIKDLLEMSSLASGAAQQFDLASIPPATVVAGGVDSVRRHLDHRLLEIHSHLEALPPICVDARRIEQVLGNLVENALKYAPGSAIRVSGDVVNGGRDVELWVEDDGAGIPAEDIVHIFDRFYRGQSARRSEVPGTGLGLAIAQAIVEGHGGQIRAENRPGGGARFILRLPAATEECHCAKTS